MGTDKFDQLVAFILKKCFDYNPCPVNGKGDGGSDFRLFGQHKYVLFQDIKSQVNSNNTFVFITIWFFIKEIIFKMSVHICSKFINQE